MRPRSRVSKTEGRHTAELRASRETRKILRNIKARKPEILPPLCHSLPLPIADTFTLRLTAVMLVTEAILEPVPAA